MIKILIIASFVVIPIVTINFIVDPATLFHNDYIDEMVNCLNQGKTVEITGDMDEAYFQKKMISSMKKEHDVVVVGSSHVMYIPFEKQYDDSYTAGLSGAYLGDYYALIGLLEYNEVLPSKVIFGVDSWAFDKPYNEGRHSGISDFAEYEYSIVNNQTIHTPESSKKTFETIKQLFSVTYFQSSVERLINKGMPNRLVVVSNTAEIGENQKIVPSARRINAIRDFKTTDEINRSANDTISSKSFFNMNSAFTHINESNFRDFLKLINHLLSMGIDVEIYLPSYYPKLYSYYQLDADYCGVIDLENIIRAYGNENQIIIRGSYNPQKVGAMERDYFDLLHLKADKGLLNFNSIIR